MRSRLIISLSLYVCIFKGSDFSEVTPLHEDYIVLCEQDASWQKNYNGPDSDQRGVLDENLVDTSESAIINEALCHCVSFLSACCGCEEEILSDNMHEKIPLLTSHSRMIDFRNREDQNK